MDDLLKPISSVINKRPTQPDINSSTTSRDVTTIADAVTVLQDSPSANELSVALSFLTNSVDRSQDAKVFQAANVVVSQIITSWWDHVSGGNNFKDLKHELLDYLRRITCIGLLVSRLKALVSALKNSSDTEGTLSGEETRPALDVLAQVLNGDDVVQLLYERSSLAPTVPRQDAGWKEIVSLLSTGRIISIVAEAEDALKMKSQTSESSWLSQGSVYSKWLGRNISKMLSMRTDDERLADSHRAAAGLLAKSLMIGYQGT
jgi:telomere length regulation protein